MADRASVDSGESVSTSEDYEIIPSNTLNVKFLSHLLQIDSIIQVYMFFLEIWW